MATSFYSEEELREIGFKEYGKDVQISRKASIYGASRMILGSHIRVDDFSLLSGMITLGNHTHVGIYSALFGGNTGIELQDFASIGVRCTIFAESNTYTAKALTNPTIPNQFQERHCSKVILGRHSVMATNAVLLPGAILAEGTVIGAMSLVTRPTEPWSIYMGVPCKKFKNRSSDLLELEKELAEWEQNQLL